MSGWTVVDGHAVRMATRKRKGAPSFRAGVVEVCQDA